MAAYLRDHGAEPLALGNVLEVGLPGRRCRDHGADLHARDDELRSTPLAHAAKSGHRHMVEFLLRHGAQPTRPDDPPWATPLAWATRRGHNAIVQLLVAYQQTGAVL